MDPLSRIERALTAAIAGQSLAALLDIGRTNRGLPRRLAGAAGWFGLARLGRRGRNDPTENEERTP